MNLFFFEFHSFNISRGDQLPEIYKKLLPQSTGKNFSCEAHSDKDSESCLFYKEIRRVSVDQMHSKVYQNNKQ